MFVNTNIESSEGTDACGYNENCTTDPEKIMRITRRELSGSVNRVLTAEGKRYDTHSVNHRF